MAHAFRGIESFMAESERAWWPKLESAHHMLNHTQEAEREQEVGEAPSDVLNLPPVMYFL